MRLRTAILLAAALAAVSAGTDASATSADEAGLYPLRDRSDLSFSPIPFGTMRSPPSLGLREVREDGCQQSRECEWADADGVRHFFWEDNELVVKRVVAREVGDNPITALGIGRARSLEDVVANVRTFLPEVDVLCENESAIGDPQDGGPARTRCGGALDEGWFRLRFDVRGMLIEVRLDASHFV